ncbi:MAG: hypothetical protein EXQ52_06300 [Bryobacterales bacterium]|nr:hypothetical protein [Bryobacterales bacterium]
MGIENARGADKDKARFEAPPIDSLKAKETQAGVTVAAEPFDAEVKMQAAFGKLNLSRHGILPMFVAIRNDSGQAIRFENLRIEYIGPDRSHVESTPAGEIAYLGGAKRPKINTGGPVPGLPGRIGKSKNPLMDWQVEGRAFSAKMLPPKETSSGFFYFQTQHHSGAKVYLTGIREAGSGKELFYFEIPLPDRGTP